MRRKAPEPLPIPWLQKPMDSAKSGFERLPDGRLKFWIEHEVIRGVTPEMLVWWFSHLEGDVDINGVRYNRYRVWHPRDHVLNHYAKRLPDGSVGPGAVIHIVEMLGGNPDYTVDVFSVIEKLDEEGFRHVPHVHGIRVGVMDYSFERAAGGTLYRNSLTIGFKGLLGRFINPLIRRFVMDEKRGRAWILHNIEEVGNFESFLPRLFASEDESSRAERVG